MLAGSRPSLPRITCVASSRVRPVPYSCGVRCATCLVEFTPKRKHHRYCSRKCRDADRSHPTTESRPCVVCGEPFTWTSARPSRNRCDGHVSSTLRGRPAVKESRPCELCGEPFTWTSAYPTRRFCCEDHRARAERARRSGAEPSAPREGVCPVCSKTFTIGNPRKAFCSKRCLWAHKSRKASRRQRRENHRARARFYGVAYVPIQPRVIYARDRWRCGVCGDPVDRLRRWPDPLSASLDHVVPMSLGGDHLPANVQCSHLACNGDTPERVVLDAGTLVVD